MKGIYSGLLIVLIILLGLSYKIVSNEEGVTELKTVIQETNTQLSKDYVKKVVGQQQLNELKALEYRIKEYKESFNPDFYIRNGMGYKKYAVKEKSTRFFFNEERMEKSINKGSGLYNIYDKNTKKILYENAYPVLNQVEYQKMRKITFGKTRTIGELGDFHVVRHLVGIMEDDVSTDCDFDENILGKEDKNNAYLVRISKHKDVGNPEAFEYIAKNYYLIGKNSTIESMPYLPFYSETKFDLEAEDWNDFEKYPFGTDEREWLKIRVIELEEDITLIFALGAVEPEIYAPFQETIQTSKVFEKVSNIELYGVFYPLLCIFIVILVFLFAITLQKENESLKKEISDKQEV